MGKPLYCGIPCARTSGRTEQRKCRSEGQAQPAATGVNDRAFGHAQSFLPVPHIFQCQRGSLREAGIPSLSFRGVEIIRVLVGEGVGRRALCGC